MRRYRVHVTVSLCEVFLCVEQYKDHVMSNEIVQTLVDVDAGELFMVSANVNFTC